MQNVKTEKKTFVKKENAITENTFVKKKKICLSIEKSFDEAAINFNKITCDLFKFRGVTAFFNIKSVKCN